MWGNIQGRSTFKLFILFITFIIIILLLYSYEFLGAIGNAIQKAKKLQSDLELQLDAAVGVDEIKVDREGTLSSAIQDAKKLQSDLELQLDITAISVDQNNEVDPESVMDNEIQDDQLRSALELQLDESIKADTETDTEIKSQSITPEGQTTEGWQG